ncbi:MFS transporter [Nocardia stercoris]|uniref:MFS transporter n=2 Tax=Nocardia stercoris TaxID=2483361 RepID=A0A3M2L4T2_9NOCA|nr:MFS transporter [Nocardia stercoris]
MLVRTPFFALGVVLTVHVVQTLGRSYAQAGLLVGVVTVCTALSGPWRGRLVDRLGLRRAILPSLLIVGTCWAIAPFTGYPGLVLLAGAAGAMEIPIFGIVRQAVLAGATEDERRSALALDSVTVEMSYMVGPILGVAAIGIFPTSWVLLGVQSLHVLGGVLLWLVDLPLRSDDETTPPVPRREWLRGPFLALCVGAAVSTVLLAGTELTVVAAMRGFGDQRWLGLTMAIWGLGSLLGGLTYGAIHRPVSTYLLLAGLGLVTYPLIFATGPVTLTALAFVSGFFCAPTLTAGVDELSRVVPEGGRGEALGWQGGAMTAGTSLGAAFAGIAIDTVGVHGAFAVAATAGLVVGSVLYLVTRPHTQADSPDSRRSGTAASVSVGEAHGEDRGGPLV